MTRVPDPHTESPMYCKHYARKTPTLPWHNGSGEKCLGCGVNLAEPRRQQWAATQAAQGISDNGGTQ